MGYTFKIACQMQWYNVFFFDDVSLIAQRVRINELNELLVLWEGWIRMDFLVHFVFPFTSLFVQIPHLTTHKYKFSLPPLCDRQSILLILFYVTYIFLPCSAVVSVLVLSPLQDYQPSKIEPAAASFFCFLFLSWLWHVAQDLMN